jgi:cytochrome c553
MKTALKLMSAAILVLAGPVNAQPKNGISTEPIQEHERAALFPSASMIKTGRTVAQAACAECHGMDGLQTGNGQPHLAGQRVVYLYRVLESYQNNSRINESMQHVSSFLNDEALLSVAAYYAGLAPARDPGVSGSAMDPESLGENPFIGIRKALGKCTKCHGESGNSTASGMPNLTAQDPEYFASSVQAYLDGTRSHRLMSKLVSQLDQQTIVEMGTFYAVQQPVRTETTGDGDAKAGSAAAEECAACHGADGNATNASVPTLAGQDARYFIKAMEAYQNGKRKHEKMSEAVAGLDETDIANLAAFYASQDPQRRNVRAPFTTAEWVQRCERCHGLNGNSTDPRFPMLAGQNEAYLRKAMQAYASGSRSISVMHAMSEPLSESDIERIVRHYAIQEPKSVVYIQLPCEEAGTD